MAHALVEIKCEETLAFYTIADRAETGWISQIECPQRPMARTSLSFAACALYTLLFVHLQAWTAQTSRASNEEYLPHIVSVLLRCSTELAAAQRWNVVIRFDEVGANEMTAHSRTDP